MPLLRRGKCGGGGKYASVDLVISHKQAASVGLLRVNQQLPGWSLVCWLVTPAHASSSCPGACPLQQHLWEPAPGTRATQNMENGLGASHSSCPRSQLKSLFSYKVR